MTRRLTKKQAELIERHANAYDAKAKALKKLGHSNFKPSVLRLFNNISSCSFDRSLTRRVHGICSTPTICSDDTSFLSRGAILRTPIPLLYEHDGSGHFKQAAIGQVVFLAKSPKQITCSAVLYDNAPANLAWEMIQAGELTGFSVGVDDLHLLARIDGISFYNRFSIREISVVRVPKNDDCCHLKFYEEPER